MDPNTNLYAQFLVADGKLSCDRIMRIARFSMDLYIASQGASTTAPELEDTCVGAEC